MNVLALAGSLRAASINAAFCRAASRLAPPGLHIAVCESLAFLPLFNPDLEPDPPESVRRFKEAVDAADALIIASPEYAHGISGVLKNALDWLVSFEGFVAMPVAVINTSPRAHHAYDALLEVLETMSAEIVREASISVPLLGSCITETQMVGTPAIAHQIRGALVALNTFLELGAQPGPKGASMSRQVIFTPKAAKPPATYSQAVKAAGLIFVSGTAPHDPQTGTLVGTTIQEQTRQCLKNIAAILESAGSSLEKLASATVVLADEEDFPGMNEEWLKWFPSNPPARQGAKLPVKIPGLKISIAAIAEA